MAALYPAQVATLQIGSYFVGQYYIIVQQDPSMVHRFYSDASTMMRFDGARADSAVGMMQIHNLIMSFNYTGVEIKSAHSLDSWNGGILVMVSGLVQAKNYIGARKFAQTFFLAPQEKGYFVLNDIFQFIDDEQPHPHQHPGEILAQANYEMNVVAPNPIPEPAASDYIVREDTQTRKFTAPVTAEQTETVDKYSISAHPQQVTESVNYSERTVEQPIASFMNATNVVEDPHPSIVEEPVGEPAKHTYASILRVAKGQSGQVVPHGASLNKTTSDSLEWQFAQQASFQQSQSPTNFQPEKSNVEVVEDGAALGDEGEPRSVFVGNLPSSITTSELEQEFNNFGKLRPEGVTIRSRKETGVLYAFIEFENATGVQNALKASPVQLNGQLVHVEGRRPNNSSYRGRRGGRGRGRGGYQSDAQRGRFGGRNFGRGNGGYENNDRDYSSRPRGKGYYQRTPRQERGILGNHNQWNGQEQTEA